MGCGNSTPVVTSKPAASKAAYDTRITDIDNEDFFAENEKTAIVTHNNKVNNTIKQNGYHNTANQNGYHNTAKQNGYHKDVNSNKVQQGPVKSNQKPIVNIPVKEHATAHHGSKPGDLLLIEALEDDSQPSVSPARRRKKDLVPDVSVFKAIDEHAAKAPKSARASVQELSRYLCRPAKNHLESVRAFYKWIQLNIGAVFDDAIKMTGNTRPLSFGIPRANSLSFKMKFLESAELWRMEYASRSLTVTIKSTFATSYDTASYFSGNYKPCDPDAVLRMGSSVCSGYANLFSELCKHAGITAKCISGYAKGHSYTPEKAFSLDQKTNHAWNAVFLSGEWYFVECTWGTGHVNGKEFVRKNKEFWFLTDPEHFINDHFPYMDNDVKSSEQWQLLERPNSLEAYNKRVKFETRSRDYNIEYSHNDAVLNVQEQVKITMRSPSVNLERFNASLKQEDGSDSSKYVMAELTDLNKYVVTVKPPSQSTFKLTLSANHDKSENLVHPLVTFTIKCNKVLPNIKPLPDLFGVWGAKADVTEYGFAESACSQIHHIIDAGEKDIRLPFLNEINENVSFKMQHAEKTIDNIDGCAMLQATSGSLMIKVRLPIEGFYKLQIFSKRLDSTLNKFEHIMDLLLECTKPANPCYALPHVYPSALKYQVVLVEPLMRDLPAGSETTFIFRSPELQRVLGDKTKIEKPASNKWEFTIMTPGIGKKCNIFGTSELDGQYNALFAFKTI